MIGPSENGKKPEPPAIREPWDKQTGESGKAFHAFTIYRDLGAARSLTKVQQILAESRVASPTMVDDWSVKWRWVERCDAWDVEEDRRRRADADRARAEAARTQAMMGTLMLGAALRRVRGDEEHNIVALNPNELDAGDVARLAEVGAKLQRAGLGDTPLDLKGAVLISGPAVQTLARDLVILAFEYIEDDRQDAFLREAEAVFRRTIRQ